MIRSVFSAVVAVTLLAGSQAFAQTATDSQIFTVTVPSVLSVTAPSDQSVTHDGNDANQAFPAQLWQVACNSANGALFTVTTRSAFTNGAFKRDAQLDLAKVGGSAGNDWIVAVGTATTNHIAGPLAEAVSVSAVSTLAGAGDFNLKVTLIDNSYDDLAAGDYVMTVDGTITAN